MTDYFNTTNESGEMLAESRKKAASQQDLILNYFKMYPNSKIGPSIIWKHFDKQYLLTSVRRAITNLTEQGYLEKTTTKRPGLYGKMEYTWRLKSKEALLNE